MRDTASGVEVEAMAADLMRRARSLYQFGRDFGVLAALDLARQKVAVPEVHSVRIRGVRTPVRFRRNTIDLTIMRQVFTLKECIVPLDRAPRFIIDAGANVGYSSLLFANAYPDAKVMAIEPEASNLALLRENCREYQQIIPVDGALWPRSASLSIDVGAKYHDSFRVVEASGENAIVRAYSVPELMALGGSDRVDVLKLDIEGAEKDLFEADVSPWISRVDVILVELHDRFRSGCTAAVEGAIRDRVRRREDRGEYAVFYLH
jgi:FkbM family methyltransferase